MRVLSIDGGGMRGLIPALVLAGFESWMPTPVFKSFDMIVGTSTGAILAMGLAAGVPAGKLVDFYLERGPSIFSRSLKKRLTSLGGLADEIYDAGELEIALLDVFGERLLSEAKTKAMAVAYDIETRKTILFRSWTGEDYRVADVARATSAAPCFFEPYRIEALSGTRHACIDGGVVANNPALLALSEVTDRTCCVVSMGTGRCERPVLLEDARDFGAAQWTPHLLDIIFSGQSEEADRLCRGWLGTHYVRLQADLAEDVRMDATDAASLAVMRLAASRLLDSREAQRAMRLVETR